MLVATNKYWVPTRIASQYLKLCVLFICSSRSKSCTVHCSMLTMWENVFVNLELLPVRSSYRTDSILASHLYDVFIHNRAFHSFEFISMFLFSCCESSVVNILPFRSRRHCRCIRTRKTKTKMPPKSVFRLKRDFAVTRSGFYLLRKWHWTTELPYLASYYSFVFVRWSHAHKSPPIKCIRLCDCQYKQA